MSDIKELSEKNLLQMAENGVPEIVIRRGAAAAVAMWNGYNLDALSIDAVHEYLLKEKMYSHENEVDRIQGSYVVFSYENLYLSLVFDNRLIFDGKGNGDAITGVLKLHPDLEKWGINGSKKYNNLEMSEFVKMNRHYFDDNKTAMTLVSELQNMRTKVEKEAESSDNKRGDYKFLAAQKVIESNIPESFILVLPVFVGQDKVRTEVEINISADNFGCSLISPNLKEYIDTEAKTLIDAQLGAIREMYPQLRIYQK